MVRATATVVKMQTIVRRKGDQHYITVPKVLVDILELRKGEKFEWTLEKRKTEIVARAPI